MRELGSHLEVLKSSNDQLTLQLNEKESLIEILKSRRKSHADEDEMILRNFQEDQAPKDEFLLKMTDLCCPQGIADDHLRLDQDLIHELAESLPKIVPNILLNKREELLPLLLIAIENHKEVQTRDQLLNLLFNLNKRPDENQRKVILRGFKKIAKVFGHQKVENELLPQLWEQIDHKYAERRLLVAETCAVLLPYIPNELISSLVFSMLQQLALEDKDLLVRQSAISSFGLLILYLKNDSNKVQQVEDNFKMLLKDPSKEVIETVHQTLLHCLAHWYIEHDFDFCKLNSDIIHELIERLDNEDDQLDAESLSCKISTLYLLLPYVFDLLSKNLKEDLKSILSKEWYESWPALEWFKSSWITNMILALSKVPSSHSDQTMDVFIQIFNLVVDSTCPNFVEDHVLPKFNQYLPPPPLEETGQEFSKEELKSYQSCLLPVFVQGILIKQEAPNILADKLQELALSYCTRPELDPWPISKAIELVISHQEDAGHMDAIAELGWSLVVHPSTQVKVMASLTLQRLAMKEIEGDDLVGHKILPGLVTLSSDPDPSVRASALKGLAHVIVTSKKSSMETKEKSAFQLVSFINADHEQSVQVHLSAIQAIGFILSKDACSQKLREDLFLPKILSFVLTLEDDPQEVFKAIIEHIYTPLCLNSPYLEDDENESPPRLSLNSIKILVAPALIKISTCKEMEISANNLIGKLEASHGITLKSTSSSNANAQNATNMMMPTSTSMDEMKQKVGKLFQKPGGQPFWKK